MKQTKQAHRYAKALLGLATEQGQAEAVREDMKLIADAVNGSKELEMLLKSPVVKSDTKLRVLDKIFAEKIGDISTKYIHLIINKGREANLGLIANEFVTMSKVAQGIFQAKVVSAVALTNDVRNEILSIASKIHKGTFELEEIIDPSIVGGFILTVGDQMVDTSVKSQFRKLRQEFLNDPYVPEI